jgi:hypothetical protein
MRSSKNIAARARALGDVLECVADVAAYLAELSPSTFCTFPSEFSLQAAGRFTSADRPNVLKGLSGVSEWPMIIRMTTTGRRQQRYDHRLRDRPTHRRRDHRHGSRGPSLDRAWVARQGTERRD